MVAPETEHRFRRGRWVYVGLVAVALAACASAAWQASIISTSERALNARNIEGIRERAEQDRDWWTYWNALKRLERIDVDIREYEWKFDRVDALAIDLSKWRGRSSDFTLLYGLRVFDGPFLLSFGPISVADSDMRQLHVLANLDYLEVANADVSDTAIREFREALPHVLIIQDQDSKERFLDSKLGKPFRQPPALYPTSRP